MHTCIFDDLACVCSFILILYCMSLLFSMAAYFYPCSVNSRNFRNLDNVLRVHRIGCHSWVTVQPIWRLHKTSNLNHNLQTLSLLLSSHCSIDHDRMSTVVGKFPSVLQYIVEEVSCTTTLVMSGVPQGSVPRAFVVSKLKLYNGQQNKLMTSFRPSPCILSNPEDYMQCSTSRYNYRPLQSWRQ